MVSVHAAGRQLELALETAQRDHLQHLEGLLDRLRGLAQDSPDVELADLYSIDKNIAWLDGLEFDQLIVRRQGDHFLAMVKATKGKKPYIAYVASQTYADTLQTVASFASKGVLTWKEDIYPSKRVRSR